jgi:propionyl-CoA synthetase
MRCAHYSESGGCSHLRSRRRLLQRLCAYITDPRRFWDGVAQDVHWHRPYDRVLSTEEAPFYKWYQGGLLNTSYNALDRHVEEGRGSQLALIFDSAIQRVARAYTFKELLTEVAAAAGVLARLGVKKGDCVGA